MWFRTKAVQPNGLIGVLLDATAPEGDRHGAAMDLGAYDGDIVEEVLARFACDQAAEEELADACGQSLAEHWIRQGGVTEAILVKAFTGESNHRDRDARSLRSCFSRRREENSQRQSVDKGFSRPQPVAIA